MCLHSCVACMAGIRERGVLPECFPFTRCGLVSERRVSPTVRTWETLRVFEHEGHFAERPWDRYRVRRCVVAFLSPFDLGHDGSIRNSLAVGRNAAAECLNHRGVPQNGFDAPRSWCRTASAGVPWLARSNHLPRLIT